MNFYDRPIILIKKSQQKHVSIIKFSFTYEYNFEYFCKSQNIFFKRSIFMQQNVGGPDKFIRFMVGISFLLNIIILETGPVGTIILLVLGLGTLASAWTGYCPAYKPLGICTCGSCSCECEKKAE